MDFHWQGTVGFKRSSKLFCYSISGWTRETLIREFHSSSAFSATLEVFLCSPFANTTDCMSLSRINIWWRSTPAMINKDSGMHHHPSLSPSLASVPGPTLQTQRLGSCSFPIHYSLFLSPRHEVRFDGISGLGKVGWLMSVNLTVTIKPIY